MWLSPAQAVTLTSGPSFLSAVCAGTLNLTQNHSVKDNRKEEVDVAQVREKCLWARAERSWDSTGQQGKSSGSTSGKCSEVVRKQDQELSG